MIINWASTIKDVRHFLFRSRVMLSSASYQIIFTSVLPQPTTMVIMLSDQYSFDKTNRTVVFYFFSFALSYTSGEYFSRMRQIRSSTLLRQSSASNASEKMNQINSWQKKWELLQRVLPNYRWCMLWLIYRMQRSPKIWLRW